MSDISLTASMRTNLLSLQNTQSLMDTTQERLSTGKKVNSAIDNPSSYYTAQNLTNRAGDLEGLFVEQAKAVANTARDSSIKTEVSSTGTFTAPGTAADITVKVGDKEYTYNVQTTDDIDAVVDGLKDELAGDEGFTFANVDGQLAVQVEAGKAVDKSTVSITSENKFGLEMSGSIDTASRMNSLKQFNDILAQIDQLASDASYKGVNLLKGDELKVIFNERNQKRKDGGFGRIGLDRCRGC